MSLSLLDLQGEIREYFGRIEEVLSGMDVILTQLENRVARLEGSNADEAAPPATTEQRIARLEGQLASLVDSLFDQDQDGEQRPGGIVLGR